MTDITTDGFACGFNAARPSERCGQLAQLLEEGMCLVRIGKAERLRFGVFGGRFDCFSTAITSASKPKVNSWAQFEFSDPRAGWGLSRAIPEPLMPKSNSQCSASGQGHSLLGVPVRDLFFVQHASARQALSGPRGCCDGNTLNSC